MPRPKSLPTPANSTDIVAVEKTDMEGTFALPPPASPPISPKGSRKRTLSGARKDDAELPPPPSRARKIIQMKPKSNSTSSASDYSPPKPAAKRKQPSNTSAAGRKIARKTAHSIIERRRRSKMNEEFGVLKDMIPACEGAEMHKLAILQAGIEYLTYLEGCVKQLKSKEDEPAVEWEHRKPSMVSTSSSNPSPDIMPQHRPVLPSIHSLASSPKSATPTPTLLSPAFNAIKFSPDLMRSNTGSTNTSISNASPNILPLPQAMMEMKRESMSEDGAEATATAALMMMGNDRRSMKAKGMSVRDLLTS